MLGKLTKRRGFLLVAVVLVAALLFDGAYAGLRFRSSFKGAACHLKKAIDRVQEFDLDTGVERLELARERLEAARGYLSHPSVVLAARMPFIGSDVRALRALAAAAEEAVGAGLDGAEAASALGFSGGASLKVLYEQGRVRFDALAEGAAALDAAVDRLTRARALLDESPEPRLGPVRSAFFGASRIVNDATAQLADAEQILQALPGFLGEGGERRYLLTFQTPSEARGGGGLVGVYGVLSADAGELQLEKIGPIRELVPKLKGPVSAPEWYEALYANLDATGGWREANLSPTFPTVARVFLRMYEASVGERLDGVVSMDPFVVADLTRGTGPIRVKGMDVAVGPDNAAEILLKDIYLEFERREDEQNAFLRRLVDALWKKIGSGDVDGTELALGMAHAIRTQRLKVFSQVPGERSAFELAGLSGDPAYFGPNVQMVFHNNFAANKVDYFLHRSQRVNVVLDEQGGARVVTTVDLDNDAPRGELDPLKETDLNVLPAGMNRMGLFFLLPENATVNDFFTGAASNTYFEGLESARYPIAWRVLLIPVQEEVQTAVSYSVPNLVSFEEGDGRFKMTFLPQSLVTPDAFDLKIVPPPGYRIGRDEPGARFSKDAFTFTGVLQAPKTVELRLIEPGAALVEESSLGGACG